MTKYLLKSFYVKRLIVFFGIWGNFVRCISSIVANKRKNFVYL